MYPHAPQSHRPTNYWYVLAACVALMLLILWTGLKAMSAHFSASPAEQTAANAALSQPAAAPSAKASAAIALQPTAVAAAAPDASASAGPLPSGIIDVQPKQLQDEPATYRSRVVRVSGKVFYVGKVDAGKTWIQIVDDNNVYVDGVMSDALPSGVTKGTAVQVTGVGAGLYTITASNGKDYDQAYIDPIQKIEVASS
ncbi:MAG TPA: hypothetical protein VFS62_12385 [Chloroflexota bacterium]|jgi:hypothetical protein|nr:hypothetical protein [Chloroflexota bacterium]